jgi:arginase
VLAGARNLDPLEQQLLDATGVMQVRGMSDIAAAAHALAQRVDAIYLHVDTDVLDPAWVPTVHLGEPNGPSLASVCAAVAQIVATCKVAVYTLASVRNFGEGRDISVASGVSLMRAGLWDHPDYHR